MPWKEREEKTKSRRVDTTLNESLETQSNCLVRIVTPVVRLNLLVPPQFEVGPKPPRKKKPASGETDRKRTHQSPARLDRHGTGRA